MVQFMNYEDSIIEACNKGDRKIIIYGTGPYAESYSHYISNISYACSTYSERASFFKGLRVLSPQELEKIHEKMIIIIFTKRQKSLREIKELLGTLNIEADVYEFGNNVAFNCYYPKTEKKNPRKIGKIRLICYGDQGWILEKFALRMQELLEKRGIETTIGRTVDENADINHHLDFGGYEPICDNRDTIMITHILHKDIAEMAIKQLETARMGICMSKETMDKLVILGAPREKLCYVNPAHDGNVKPKKFILGITHRNYKDHRKRQGALLDICDKLDPQYFAIKIMGSGWEEDVERLRDSGFEVEYYPKFDYEIYRNLMSTFDYFLYWGFDEGTMGYLDAVAAGVETLVTPQGYHLDVKDGITYPCRTINDFIDVLLQKQEERYKRIQAVKEWTWENYVDKHLKIWNYILENNVESIFYEKQHLYEDGENSVFRNRNIWD